MKDEKDKKYSHEGVVYPKWSRNKCLEFDFKETFSNISLYFLNFKYIYMRDKSENLQTLYTLNV